jgi:hypothetical protein
MSLLSFKYDVQEVIGTTLYANLVGMWHMDEGTGLYAYDASGNNHTGTLYNSPTWATGHFGPSSGALNFASVSTQYVSASGNTISSNAAFTLSAWVKAGAMSANGCALSIGSATGSNGAWIGYNNATGFFAGGLYSTIISSTVALDTNWHLLTLVFSGGAGGTLTLYVDGVSSGTPATVTPSISGSTMCIGAMATSIWYWNGIVDEARIYNIALAYPYYLWYESAPCVIIGNETDVVDIVPLNSLGTFYENAIGIWHFDEGSGTVAHDASIIANTGTIYSSPTWVTAALSRFGRSLTVDGNTKAVTLSPFGYLPTVSSGLSVFAWVYISGSTLGNVFQYMDANNGFSLDLGQVNSASEAWEVQTNKSGAGVVDNTSVSSLGAGAWYNIGFTWNGSALILYVNGALNTTCYPAGISTPDVSTIPKIGGVPLGWTGNANTFNVDEVRVYNYCLTATEVSRLWCEGYQGGVISSGDYVVESYVDLANMAGGDTVVLTEYISTDGVYGGPCNSRVYQYNTYANLQNADGLTPVIRFHSKFLNQYQIYHVTLKQTTGTGKSFPVESIMQVLNS